MLPRQTPGSGTKIVGSFRQNEGSMARIPCFGPNCPEAAALAARIANECGSRPYLYLYAMLLHSVRLAEDWLESLTFLAKQPFESSSP